MTPRTLIAISLLVLFASAVAVGMTWGANLDALHDLNTPPSAWTLLATLGVFLLVTVLWAMVTHALLRIFLGWALGRTGLQFIRILSFVSVGWFGLMLMTSVVWAWAKPHW